MTGEDVMMELIWTSAQSEKVPVVLVAGGSVVMGVPIDAEEYLAAYGEAEKTFRKVLATLESDGGESMYLRDASVRLGDTTYQMKVLALSRSAIAAIAQGFPGE